jgi:hypothetical protein
MGFWKGLFAGIVATIGLGAGAVKANQMVDSTRTSAQERVMEANAVASDSRIIRGSKTKFVAKRTASKTAYRLTAAEKTSMMRRLSAYDALQKQVVIAMRANNYDMADALSHSAATEMRIAYQEYGANADNATKTRMALAIAMIEPQQKLIAHIHSLAVTDSIITRIQKGNNTSQDAVLREIEALRAATNSMTEFAKFLQDEQERLIRFEDPHSSEWMNAAKAFVLHGAQHVIHYSGANPADYPVGQRSAVETLKGLADAYQNSAADALQILNR